jgi:hypothetical protein
MKNVKKNLKIYSEIIQAYSDCNETDGERNLDYFASQALSAEDLKEITPKAIPDGYNGFDSIKSIEKLVEVFGDAAEYYMAREGSVCIYIKPLRNIWLRDLKELRADEILYCPIKQMFRIWWD